MKPLEINYAMYALRVEDKSPLLALELGYNGRFEFFHLNRKEALELASYLENWAMKQEDENE